MTGALLRTGNLKAFEPLGALGNPVYLAAAQLRAAIGRRLGEDAAAALAIPHRNQDGDTIDWYAPGPGPVVPWSAATPEERTQAKEQLLGIRDRIEELGRAMQSEEAGERQVFGRLLEQVTSFPDDGHVYLVQGRPVITFWGFQHQSAPVGSSPLLNLDVEPRQAPLAGIRRSLSWWWLLPLLLLLALLLIWLLRGCEEPPVQRRQEAVEAAGKQEPEAPAEESAPTEEPPPTEEPAPEEIEQHEPVSDPERRDLVIRGGETRVLERDGITTDQTRATEGAVAVDPATGELLEESETDVEAPGLTQVQEGALEAPSEVQEDVLGEAPGEEIPVGEESVEQPLPEEESEDVSELAQPDEAPDATEGSVDEPLPEQAPETEAPEPSGPEPAQEPPPSEQGPGDQESQPRDQPADGVPPDEGNKPDPANSGQDEAAPALKLPPGSIRTGSTQFLNGGWRTSGSLQDPRTALPVDMEYRLQDGTGELKLRRSDGSICSGEVKAVIEDGKLVVHNARDIKCPDGTNFGRPRLECIPGKDGRADCSGRYETGEVFSIDIKKSEQ